MLPCAAAAFTKYRAHGFDPVGAGLQHLEGMSPDESSTGIQRRDANAIPWNREARKYHSAVGQTPNTVPPSGQGVD